MDLFDRIASFAEAAGPIGLTLVGVAGVVLLLLTITGSRMTLLGLYALLLMFSGFTVESINLGSTLMRWVVMFLIAMTCFSGARYPGTPAVLLSLYAVMGMLLSPLAPSLVYALQFSLLLLVLSFPTASATAGRIRTVDDVHRLLKLLIAAGGLYVILGLSSLGSLTSGHSPAARFSGATSSAPLFVLTGGLLLPVALWGALQTGLKQWRVYCVVIALCTGMLCLVSGQRTGTLAGFIGCVPLLLRFGVKKVGLGLAMLALGLALVWGVLSLMPAQREFVIRRFTSADTTGRFERWTMAVTMCLRKPWLGRGVAASNLSFGFHNAYLVAWYEVGVLGLVLYAGAFFLMAWQALRLTLKRTSRQVSDVARLMLGLTLANMAAAFFESKLNSPSNVAMFMAVMSSVILVRLRQFSAEPAGAEPAGQLLAYDATYDTRGLYGPSPRPAT